MIGIIPIAGDVFDIVWKANTKNIALLHPQSRPPNRGQQVKSYVFYGTYSPYRDRFDRSRDLRSVVITYRLIF